MESNAYVHFYWEGVVTPWTDKSISKYYNIALPPRLIPPLNIKYPSLLIIITNDYSRNEIEGKRFSIPYEIQVFNDTNKIVPLENILWYASIYKSRGDIIPFGYHSAYKNHPVKYLEYPIPAIYNDEADDQIFEGAIIKAYNMTDKNGKVIFKDLRLSESGPSGNYTIEFNCGNDAAISSFDVSSSIDKSKLKFIKQIKSPVIVSDSSISEFDLLLEIVVYNKENYGIYGKYPEEIYILTQNSRDQKYILAEIVHESSSFEASNEDGIMTIPVRITKLLQSTIANITVTIDSFNLTSQYIEFILDHSQQVDLSFNN